jgi:hypothetical protein
MRARPHILTLALLVVAATACADSPVTRPSGQSDVPQHLRPPVSLGGDLTPADSALCRSGYTLPNGRSCEGIV